MDRLEVGGPSTRCSQSFLEASRAEMHRVLEINAERSRNSDGDDGSEAEPPNQGQRGNQKSRQGMSEEGQKRVTGGETCACLGWNVSCERKQSPR
jgi:hypothetical protein